LAQPSIAILSRLIGRINGQPANHPESILRAVALIGHFEVFRRMRAVTLHALGWKNFAAERRELVEAFQWKQIKATVIDRSA
jgi:TetR/AcrR family transcriptional regulator, regulator of cefoperazone and chloramphenicol sensitivity